MDGIKQWQIWRAFIAFDDAPDQGKERPVVIVSKGTKLFALGLKVTSTPKRYGYDSDYQIQYWKEAGLSNESVCRLDHFYEIKVSDLKYKIGQLHPNDILRISIFIGI